MSSCLLPFSSFNFKEPQYIISQFYGKVFLCYLYMYCKTVWDIHAVFSHSQQVVYLRVRRSHYVAARRAFLLERAQKEPHGEEDFEKEIAKVSVDNC